MRKSLIMLLLCVSLFASSVFAQVKITASTSISNPPFINLIVAYEPFTYYESYDFYVYASCGETFNPMYFLQSGQHAEGLQLPATVSYPINDSLHTSYYQPFMSCNVGYFTLIFIVDGFVTIHTVPFAI